MNQLLPKLPAFDTQAMFDNTGAVAEYIRNSCSCAIEDLERSTYEIFPRIPASIRDRHTPLVRPLYWLLPSLVGQYSNADQESTTAALHDYSCAALVRILAERQLTECCPASLAEVLRTIESSRQLCRLEISKNLSFEDCFANKCESWWVVIRLGLQKLCESGNSRTISALRAIYSVFSALQLVDDWNDRDEDRCRLHWNAWEYCPEFATSALHIVLEQSVKLTKGLENSPLRVVLSLQTNQNVYLIRRSQNLSRLPPT
jgi:hypothetical protein